MRRRSMTTGISSGAGAPEGVMVTRPSWMSDGSSGVDHVRIVSGFGEVLVTETVKDGGEVGGEGAERESGRLERVVVCGEDILIWNGRVRPVRRLKRCSVVMAVRFMVVLDPAVES